METTLRNTPPFRADHVGSLLRPRQLFEARRRWREGQLPRDELRKIEDEHVRAAVQMQESVGLQGVTDGDFRRNDWFLDFMLAFDGVERDGERQPVAFSGGATFRAPIPRVSGRFACPAGGIDVEAFRFLKSATRRTAKLCIPAPAMFHTIIERRNIESKIYRDVDEFWRDLGEAYNAAVKHYVDAGCTYLQMDDVNSATIADEKWQSFWRNRGLDPQRQLESFITLNNAAVAGRPANLTVVIHMCRGNFQSQWTAQGSYDMVAERYFNQSSVDGFFLEYDDERSGGFAPLRYMPKDKIVVLGLMTSKRPELESKDEIRRRIDEAARYVSPERLCISPQCGFASTQEGNRLTEDEQWRKLAHLVEIAEGVWGSA